ncbi:hypothetical protein HHI36_022711 [Cryptolaemus montrouzieri]|uniref:Uncharacterized protein n=1 Tax=Cryptolaemus montrouzieri TaxID=559131 RepID=A0ABD2N0K6_9CUCU
MDTTRGSFGDPGYQSFSSDNLHNATYGTNDSYPPIDEMGSRSSLARDVRDDTTGFDHWEMNYHEAAIFLEEGENNEKFDSHPRHPSALPAYLLVHNSWYYGLDLAFSLVLLSLALFEKPSVDNFDLPVGIHGTLELLALGVIGIELALKLRWIGWGTILKHKRTMVKCVTLIIMVMEALVVLARQSSLSDHQSLETNILSGHEGVRRSSTIHSPDFTISAAYFGHVNFTPVFRLQLRPLRVFPVQSAPNQSLFQNVAG